MPLWDGRETPEEYEERKRRNEEKAAAWEERQRVFEEKRRAWEEGETVRQYNRGRMEHLTHEAQGLLYASDFYSPRAHQEMKALQASAKEHRYVGRDHQHLNDEFWQVSQAFYDKRDKHFLVRKRQSEEARQTMELLVSRAEMVASYPSDYQAAHTQLEQITEEMKHHRCNKEDSDYIWRKFKAIKNEFYEKWRAEKQKLKEEKEKSRWTSDSVRGVYHVEGANKAYVTSKFSTDGVKDESAEGFIAMQDSQGGKNSYIFYKDGTMSRKQQKGGFNPSNWKDK